MRWLVIVLCGFSLAFAQDISVRRESGALYVSLTDVASSLVYTVREAEGSLTITTDRGILIVFDKSPDFEWTASDPTAEPPIMSSSASVLKLDGEWFAPADLFALLGITIGARALTLPDGRSLTLDVPTEPAVASDDNSVLTDLGSNVTGLTFYKSGTAGKDTTSLLLMDMALMPRAFPDQQTYLETALAKFSMGNPLYFVVTAVSNATWEPLLVIEQNGRMVEYQHPANLTVLEGDAGRVSSDAPVSGVIVLPDWIDLRQPITVTWTGISAAVQYRQ